MRAMGRYVYRNGERHFDSTTEWLIRLPLAALCRCGHDKHTHGPELSVFNLGRCGGLSITGGYPRCACPEFSPNRLPSDFVRTVNIQA